MLKKSQEEFEAYMKEHDEKVVLSSGEFAREIESGYNCDY